MKKLVILFLSISLLGCTNAEAKEKKAKEEFYDGRFHIIYRDYSVDMSNDEMKILLDKKTKVKYLVYKNGEASGGVGITPLIEK